MIQVRNTCDGEIIVLGKIEQEACERHGIRTARKSNQDARTGRQKTVTADRPANVLMESCQSPKSQIPNPNPRNSSEIPTACAVCGIWALGFGRCYGAGGRTRTADPALMRRVL